MGKPQFAAYASDITDLSTWSRLIATPIPRFKVPSVPTQIITDYQKNEETSSLGKSPNIVLENREFEI